MRYPTCGECEHIGFKRNFNKPERKCNKLKNLLVQEDSQAYLKLVRGISICKDFTPKNWTRPKICGECSLRGEIQKDGTFRCTGYPFYKHFKYSDNACKNGKAYYGEQISMV